MLFSVSIYKVCTFIHFNIKLISITNNDLYILLNNQLKEFFDIENGA